MYTPRTFPRAGAVADAALVVAWRCSDSMSLRDFLRLENREKVPVLQLRDLGRWIGLAGPLSV
jgi:hypothetical protein